MAGAPWWEQFDPDPRESGPVTPSGARRAAPGTGTLAASAPLVVHPDETDRPEAPTPRPPRGLQVAAAVLALVLVALLGVLAARTVGASTAPAAQQGTAAGPTSAPTPSATGRPAGGTAAADAAATAELESLRREGLAAHPPEGQWVAQLAAKSVGTTDPVQTAANGSSTFYAADILTQSRTIASGAAGGDVFVLKTTDFGEGLLDKRGNPYWVTLAAGPFGNAEDVRTWCASMFASTPADERGNVCLPKQLTPPE